MKAKARTAERSAASASAPAHGSTRASSDPIVAAPPFAAAWATLVYVVTTLTVAWPALAGKFLVNPHSDQYIAGYAFREFAASSLRSSGTFPLWNPYLFGGMPYVAAMHGDLFYPTFLLRMTMPTDAAMTWGFIIHVVLAGLFTYLFLRALGLSFFGALVGGVAYQLGGNFAAQVTPGHDGKMFVSALLPAMLLLLVRGLRDDRRWAWGLLAIVVGLSVLSPHPQLLQYSLLGAGSFALLLAFADVGAGRLERSVALRRLGFALAAVIVGAAIGAVQYLPVREYVAWSPRAQGIGGYEVATSFSLPPEEAINFYIPQFSGILEHYWGRNGFHYHSEYIGAAVLLLAGAAFGSGDRARRTLARYFLGVFVIALLWAMGGFTPFYQIIYALVPGTKFFRAPSTMLFMVSFATACLAALGAERVLAGGISRRYLIGWGIAAGVVVLLSASGGFAGLATSLVGPERYESVGGGAGLLVGALRSLLFTAAAAGIAYAATQRDLAPKALGWGLVAVVTLDLWSVLRIYWMWSPPAAVTYASNPAIDYLRRIPEPGRVLAVPVSAQMAFHDPDLVGAGLMAHGIRQALGYHGNEIGRFTILGGRDAGYQNATTPTFASLYNIRYLMTNGEVPSLEKIVGPVQDAAGTTTYLYRMPGDNPLAWVVPLMVKAPDEPTLATISNPQFDVRRAALFDSASTVTAAAATTATTVPPALPITVAVTKLEPGHMAFQLSGPAPSGSALMVSENYYPGWTAKADGRETPVGRADFTLIGVQLPPGARNVELSFTSAAYERGKLITFAALALAALAAIGGAVVDRRSRG